MTLSTYRLSLPSLYSQLRSSSLFTFKQNYTQITQNATSRTSTTSPSCPMRHWTSQSTTKAYPDLSSYGVSPAMKMKAIAKEQDSQGLWMVQRDIPKVREQELRIKVKKASICGTDLHIYKWDDWSKKNVPLKTVLGHEFVGEVVELGSNVSGFSIGDRVTAEGHITCGQCRSCRAGKRHLCRVTTGIGIQRDGAFADYVSVPAGNTFLLGDKISDDIASFMDPLGNAVHCALSFDLVGEDVLITGAGPIGIMATAVCKHIGARYVVVTDVNDFRLDLAKKCGADAALNVRNSPNAVAEILPALGMKEGFDVALEMSGNPHAFEPILNNMRMGGKIAVLGIASQPVPIDLDKVVFKALEMKGVYGREIFETWYKMKNMLIDGLQDKLKPVITHIIKAEDFEQGFKAMQSGTCGKVVMSWD